MDASPTSWSSDKLTQELTPWALMHYYFESLQVGRSLYKGMPPTQPAVLKSCPGIHHICCHRTDVWGRTTKTEPSSCTHPAPPSAHTWNLCSSLSWNLLYMLLQKETSKHKYKSICGMLLTPPTHISRHKQTAGAAQAGLLWEGSRALPHLSRPQMGLQPLYTNPNYLVSFFFCLFSPINHPL